MTDDVMDALRKAYNKGAEDSMRTAVELLESARGKVEAANPGRDVVIGFDIASEVMRGFASTVKEMKL